MRDRIRRFPPTQTSGATATTGASGHWLTGRYANAPLAETVAQLLTDYGFAEHETGALNGTVPGYVIDRVMAARDALQPLELAYFFDPLESGGAIQFRHRGVESPVAVLARAISWRRAPTVRCCR